MEIINVAAILFLTISLPLWIVLHYVTRWKKTRELSGSDETMLEDLWGLAQRLESRIDALETILDDHAPEWRRPEWRQNS